MGNCSSSDVTHPDTFTALPTFKIALVGESKAGKTAIFNRFVKNCFFKTYVPTKKVDIVNVIKKVNVPEHVIVSLTLWDTPGRDDIDMAHTYFSHIDAVIVVVDVTDKESMEMAAYWKQEIINTVTHHSDMSISDALKLPILLLGNKYDLVDKEKPGYESDENSKDFSGEKLDDSDELMIITEEEKWKPECVHKIEQLVQQHGFLSGVMVSAKDSDGSVHQAMQTLIRKLMENTLQQMYGDEYKKRSKKRPKKQSKAIVETSLKLTEIESSILLLLNSW
ncbi:hypothetical protein EB796_005086 [Bugula neritina]|uniref:Uncharacterized protein n=1 Tax=Bugula neritina TaxID=10212 RepID=A0A7J7KE86_BUGNE|nr:hypothetical protein EB796_005086 [Bugula neritina]